MRGAPFRFLVATAIIPLAAAAQTLPFEGTWALQPDWCQNPRPDQQPIILDARHLETDGMRCDFSSVLPGAISFRIEAECTAGAAHGHEFFTFAVLDGRLYWNWAEGHGTFVRCGN